MTEKRVLICPKCGQGHPWGSLFPDDLGRLEDWMAASRRHASCHWVSKAPCQERCFCILIVDQLRGPNGLRFNCKSLRFTCNRQRATIFRRRTFSTVLTTSNRYSGTRNINRKPLLRRSGRRYGFWLPDRFHLRNRCHSIHRRSGDFRPGECVEDRDATFVISLRLVVQPFLDCD
jgi:hypothetical protein